MDAPADVRDAPTIAKLRKGDARAFAALLDRWYGSTVRLARLLAPDDATARRAAREAWLATIAALPTLDGTLPPHLVLLRATIDSVAVRLVAGEPGTAVAPDSFEPEGHRWAGWWQDEKTPTEWGERPSDGTLIQALGQLEPSTATVVMLRDVESLPPDQVEMVLELTPTDQLLLLHKGRTAIRQTLAESTL